jgi:hypothetical protein
VKPDLVELHSVRVGELDHDW